MRTIYKLLFPLVALVMTSCAYKNINNEQLNSTSSLHAFENNPKNVKELISQALTLSKRKLNYHFGSADPEKSGGLDCSGTMYYLLHDQINIPRQSDQIYSWAKRHGKFYSVKSRRLASKDFTHLKAGDLLFWTGTYKVRRRSQVTHVMLYLGKNKEGKHLMFGAENRRGGVNVFEFTLPRSKSRSRFIGYSCIPRFSC